MPGKARHLIGAERHTAGVRRKHGSRRKHDGRAAAAASICHCPWQRRRRSELAVLGRFIKPPERPLPAATVALRQVRQCSQGGPNQHQGWGHGELTIKLRRHRVAAGVTVRHADHAQTPLPAPALRVQLLPGVERKTAVALRRIGPAVQAGPDLLHTGASSGAAKQERAALCRAGSAQNALQSDQGAAINGDPNWRN